MFESFIPTQQEGEGVGVACIRNKERRGKKALMGCLVGEKGKKKVYKNRIKEKRVRI